MLSRHHIITESALFEEEAKAFAAMVATIIEQELWADVLEKADAHLVKRP